MTLNARFRHNSCGRIAVSSMHYLAAIILGVSIDQISKLLADLYLSHFHSLIIIPNSLNLVLVHNYGAAYGILQNQRWLLSGISIAVLIVLFIVKHKLVQNRLSHLGYTFFTAGIIGNLLDRLMRGYVIDFLDIGIIPVFNFADIMINIGLIMLIIDAFFSHE
ncbi:signal peptidase II [Thermoproteota archaeon]